MYLQHIFFKMSLRRLPIISVYKKTSSNYFLKTSSRRFGRQKNVTLKTSSVQLHQDECLLSSKHFLFSKRSWRRLKDVFSVTFFHLPRRPQDVLRLCLEDFFEEKKCYVQDALKTSSRRLQYIFTRTKVCFVEVKMLRFINCFLKFL